MPLFVKIAAGIAALYLTVVVLMALAQDRLLSLDGLDADPRRSLAAQSGQR
jgi:hypothetical protein